MAQDEDAGMKSPNGGARVVAGLCHALIVGL